MPAGPTGLTGKEAKTRTSDSLSAAFPPATHPPHAEGTPKKASAQRAGKN